MTATNKCYNFVGFRCRPPLRKRPVWHGHTILSTRDLLYLFIFYSYYFLFITTAMAGRGKKGGRTFFLCFSDFFPLLLSFVLGGGGGGGGLVGVESLVLKQKFQV